MTRTIGIDLALALALAAGCGGGTTTSGGATSPIDNTTTAPAWAPSVDVVAADVPGWIAVRPAAAFDAETPYWVPIDATSTAVLFNATELTAPTDVHAIVGDGEARTLRFDGEASIEYGCDGGRADVGRLVGEPLPGPVAWVLPAVPAGWQPAAYPVREIEASTARRAWAAGPLAIELTRDDDTHATLAIAGGDRTLGRLPFEKYYMTGADELPIDLADRGDVGMPEVLGAYAIAPGGPALVTLLHPGYEGVSIQTLLVGADAVTPVEALDVYLYFCAF